MLSVFLLQNPGFEYFWRIYTCMSNGHVAETCTLIILTDAMVTNHSDEFIVHSQLIHRVIVWGASAKKCKGLPDNVRKITERNNVADVSSLPAPSKYSSACLQVKLPAWLFRRVEGGNHICLLACSQFRNKKHACWALLTHLNRGIIKCYVSRRWYWLTWSTSASSFKEAELVCAGRNFWNSHLYFLSCA